MTNDTLRVGARAVPLAEIERDITAFRRRQSENDNYRAYVSHCGESLLSKHRRTLLKYATALVAEVRRLRAVERAAQAVVDCEAGDARARLLARLALILAPAPDTEGGTDG